MKRELGRKDVNVRVSGIILCVTLIEEWRGAKFSRVSRDRRSDGNGKGRYRSRILYSGSRWRRDGNQGGVARKRISVFIWCHDTLRSETLDSVGRAVLRRRNLPASGSEWRTVDVHRFVPRTNSRFVGTANYIGRLKRVKRERFKLLWLTKRRGC